MPIQAVILDTTPLGLVTQKTGKSNQLTLAASG